MNVGHFFPSVDQLLSVVSLLKRGVSVSVIYNRSSFFGIRGSRSVRLSRYKYTSTFIINTFPGKCFRQQVDRIDSAFPYSENILFKLMMATSSYLSSNQSHQSRVNNNIPKKFTGGHAPQQFDYFLVLDFEATCDNKRTPNPQEIIEFPVLKVNARTLNVDSVFHQYVLPQYHPQLTPFCTELTGIIQEMVNDQPHLPEVLKNFHKWMLAENLLDPECKVIFVTCGDWDLKSMLPKQCAYLDFAREKYFGKWINIKKAYAEMTGVFPKGMMPMLQNLNIQHIGRHHSGIDDCRNIANILITMLQQGFIFKQTGTLT